MKKQYDQPLARIIAFEPIAYTKQCEYPNCTGVVKIFFVTTENEHRERMQAIELDKHLLTCPVAQFELWRQSQLKGD